MSAAERIAAALEMRPTKPGQWRRRCPCHGGMSETSLSVWDKGNGDAGIHDFGGCDAGQILETVGPTLAHLYDDNWNTRTTNAPGGLRVMSSAKDKARDNRARRAVGTTKYPLREQDGRVVAVHGRSDFDDGTKDVWWERPDRTKGLGGKKVGELPLYGIHELGASSEVVVTEGEKARDALARLSTPALGTVTGAEGTPNDAMLRPLLKVPAVYLWPDNDDPGRSHMTAVAARLVALGHPDVRMIERHDAPPKDDAADFEAAGGTADDVRRLKATAARVNASDLTPPIACDGPRLEIVRLSDVEARPIDWLWPDWLARGKVHILGGHPGDGKSTLTAWLAAVLSRGGVLPDEAIAPSGGTLFLLGEDSLDDTLRPRLDLHDADATRIDAIRAVTEGTQRRAFDLRKHLDIARAELTRRRYLLFVIDPLTAFMPQTDRNAEGDVRDVLTLVTDLAEETDVAVLAVMHVGKPNGTNRRPLQQLLGATAFGAAARLVMMVAEVPHAGEDDEVPSRRVLGVVKSNLAPKPPGLEWSRAIDGPVTWHGTTDYELDLLLAGAKPKPIEAAKAFLFEQLKGGSKTAVGLDQGAKSEGISKATLRRAADALGVIRFKQPGTNSGPWLWRLPDGTPQQADTGEDAHPADDPNESTFALSEPKRAEGDANGRNDGKVLTVETVSMFPEDSSDGGRCSNYSQGQVEHLRLFDPDTALWRS
ncbi:MAG: AAA family ATPase [Chloroflexia bacterium]|nr:AAA family ATPase [Chloroflexia bacterium]